MNLCIDLTWVLSIFEKPFWKGSISANVTDFHQWKQKPNLKQLVLDVCSLGLELLWMLLYISSGVYPKVGQGQPLPCIFSSDR